MTAQTSLVAAAALLVRDDGRVLVVRLARGPLAGRWSLPLRVVAPEEVAEQALALLLRDDLHLAPGSAAFAETLSLAGDGEQAIVANVFLCEDWSRTPRYGADTFGDAAWVDPSSAADLDALAGGGLPPELRAWLSRTAAAAATGGEAGGDARRDPAALRATLRAAREELLAAFEAVPVFDSERERGQPTAEDAAADCSAIDVLAHCATVEAYTAAEARRLLELPGHSWRDFNPDQHRAERRWRPRAQEPAERERLATVRAATEAWLAGLDGAALAAYGNHPERGVVRVGERIHTIAQHDRRHAAQLGAMGADRQTGDGDAAADR